MKSDYEENKKILSQVKVLLKDKKEVLKKLNEDIKKLNEKYPNINIDELLEKNVNIADYIKKRSEFLYKKEELYDLNAEYIKLLTAEEDLQTIINYQTTKINGKVDNVEISQIKKNNIFEKLNKIISKEGILNGKDATELAMITSKLDEAKYLTQEEKDNIRNIINNRLEKNNEMINNTSLKAKKSKSITKNFSSIKEKINNIISKGKDSSKNNIEQVSDNDIQNEEKITLDEDIFDFKQEEIKNESISSEINESEISDFQMDDVFKYSKEDLEKAKANNFSSLKEDKKTAKTADRIIIPFRDNEDNEVEIIETTFDDIIDSNSEEVTSAQSYDPMHDFIVQTLTDEKNGTLKKR